jgi:hypothetical protein
MLRARIHLLQLNWLGSEINSLLWLPIIFMNVQFLNFTANTTFYNRVSHLAFALAQEIDLEDNMASAT